MVCQPCPWFARIVLSSPFVSCTVWFLTRIITGWAFIFLLALWQKFSILVVGSCMILTSTHCKKLVTAMDMLLWKVSECACQLSLFILPGGFSSPFQNCNYSQITLFSFTFFWFALLFGNENSSVLGCFLCCLGFPLSLQWHCHSKLQGVVVPSLTVLFWGLLLASLWTCSLSGIVEPESLWWWNKPNMNVRGGVRGTKTTDQKHSFCTKWGYVRLERIRERQQSELKPQWVARPSKHEYSDLKANLSLLSTSSSVSFWSHFWLCALWF